MTTENVGAIGKTPKLVTEYRAKQLEKQQIDANPAQNAGEKAENSQLNDNFYKSMGVELTTFDENGYETNLEVIMKKAHGENAVVRTNRDSVTLKKANGEEVTISKEDFNSIGDKSKDITDLRLYARGGYRQLLENELPQLEIEHVKGWFDGTKAIPGTNDKVIDNKLRTIDYMGQMLDFAVGVRYNTQNKEDSVNQEMNDAVAYLDADPLLQELVKNSDYTDDQKKTLKEGLEQAYSTSLAELLEDFDIQVDTNGLENLKADGTRENVEAQVKILDEILSRIPDNQTFTEDLTVGNKRPNKIQEKVNITLKTKNLNEIQNRIKNLVESRYREEDEEREFTPDVAKQLSDLQNTSIKQYVELQKLELLKDALGNIRKEVQELRDKLDAANTELKQMEEFEENADVKSTTLKKSERDNYRVRVKEVKTTGIKTAKAATNTGKAEKTDKQKDVYNQKVDAKTTARVADAASAHETKQKIEDAAKKAKTETGYYKNFGHVNQYIYDNFKDKKISREEAVLLHDALEKYTQNDADKLELIADWVKVDDQSGENIDKKAKTKVSIETDLSQLKPEELKFLLETVKDMDIELRTTKQKNEAKKQLTKILQEHRGIKASEEAQEYEEAAQTKIEQETQVKQNTTLKSYKDSFNVGYKKETEDPK